MEGWLHPALLVGVPWTVMAMVVLWRVWRRPDLLDRVKPSWWDGGLLDRLHLALGCVAAIVVGMFLIVAALTGYV